MTFSELPFSPPPVQALVMDLLSPARPVDQARVNALTEDDWHRLLGAAQEHRVGPLLHWQLTRARPGLVLPARVVASLADSFRSSMLRSLQLQRELLLTHQVLDRAGTAHLALKGAGLAWHAYPHPALRPLRDLDILVPADQALAAYRQLLDGGLSRVAHRPGQPEAMMALHQHLPPLRSPSGTVTVELHSRLFHPAEQPSAPPDLSEMPGFWQRAIPMVLAGTTVHVPSPTDQLLHLIVHAVYDHEFGNGPLLLSDLAFLMDHHSIDWALFWRLAEAGQQTRGCVLALTLLQHYWGPRPIDWGTHGLEEVAGSTTQTNLVATLMLADSNARRHLNLKSTLQSQGSVRAQVGYLLRKLFPPRGHIAAECPVPADDWRVFFWYPVRWYRLTLGRLPGFFRRERFDPGPQQARQLGELRAWLKPARPLS